MIWVPDTCDCKIEFDDNTQHIRTYLKCRLHKPLKRQTLLDEVIAYNQSFNLSFGDEPDEDQQELIILSKRVTKLKIRLGDFTGELPTQGSLTKLKNFLRL